VHRSRLVIPLVVALQWVAVPGEARSQNAGCPDGAACVWNKPDFQGARAQIPPTGCIDSNIRSAVNGTDRVLVFFLSGGCVGAQAGTLAPGQEAARMGAASATGDCSHGPVDQCDDGTPETPVS
jgi:hypothetical protein